MKKRGQGLSLKHFRDLLVFHVLQCLELEGKQVHKQWQHQLAGKGASYSPLINWVCPIL